MLAKGQRGLAILQELPHHNEIAVDESGGSNKLYGDGKDYQKQYEIRAATAVAHIGEAFKEFRPAAW